MKLTEKEHQTLRFIAQGSTRFYAAKMMGTSPSGVARTLSSLYARTACATTIELVSWLLITGTLKLTEVDFPHCELPELDDRDPYAGLAETS